MKDDDLTQKIIGCAYTVHSGAQRNPGITSQKEIRAREEGDRNRRVKYINPTEVLGCYHSSVARTFHQPEPTAGHLQ
jgi:hypothetical protein